MFAETLAAKTQQALEVLKGAPRLQDFYLAGGTGLALQLGHRISEDLDFFSPQEFKPLTLLAALQQQSPALKPEDVSQSWGTLRFSQRKCLVSFFSYPFPLLSALAEFEGFKVAPLVDIACMKITAVADRGLKKDFIDLYFVCQQISFEELLEAFRQKFKSVDFELYHYLKALAYFEEAEDSPYPYMLKEVSWDEVKEFFREKIKAYQIF